MVIVGVARSIYSVVQTRLCYRYLRYSVKNKFPQKTSLDSPEYTNTLSFLPAMVTIGLLYLFFHHQRSTEH